MQQKRKQKIETATKVVCY